MSTKIYNAYYVPHGMDGVLAIKKFIEQKYEEHVHARLNEYADYTGKQMIPKPGHLTDFERQLLEHINTYKKPEIPEWERPLREMGTLELEYVINAASRCTEKGILLDFDQSMVVYWYQKKAYVQFFCFNSDWNKEFQELHRKRKIKDFHYQNSTDKPDWISEEKWDAREAVWDGIFKEQGADAPAQCGFTVRFNSRIQYILFRWKNLIHRGNVDSW
jgi:hypothetical protein